MIITVRSMARIVPLILVVVLLQAGFFSLIHLLGVSPWVLPALVAIFGLLGGRLIGAVTGFAVGFLADALIDAPLGATSLVLMIIGYACGSYRERGGFPSVRWTGVVCGLATVAALVLYGLVLGALGLEGSLSPGAFTDLVIQGLYGFLLGMPLFIVAVRILRPALVVGNPARRRRRDSEVLES